MSTITNTGNILPRPPRTLQGYERLSSWVEEGIWGHRLWHRQTPWLLFLEFLNIAEAGIRNNSLFSSEIPSPVSSYKLHQRIALRNLIFNNESLARTSESLVADSVRWSQWIAQMNADCEPDQGINFDYLQSRFSSFSDFAVTVQLLRQTAIGPNSSRRWSSQFVFPFGTEALYEDLSISDKNQERQYINFGRTGDLLYMMLSRSRHAQDLAAEFSRHLSVATIPTKMLEKLRPPDASPLSKERKGGYLPYRSHPAFERLAEDWLSVLRLRLPGQDAYAHLVPLGAFHILLYQMETAAAWLNRGPPPYVCEVLGPKTQFVRQRATRSYMDNDGLAWAAIEHVARDFMSSPKWVEIVENPTIVTERERVEAAAQLLGTELWMTESELAQCGTIEILRQVVTAKLRNKCDDNVDMLHLDYGKSCGLVSKRNARSYRYAPTDSFLKTLVLTNVERRMEINEFLDRLFARYRLVFGPAEAKQCLEKIDQDETAFETNRERLEERLRSMGLVNRLSDGVAYVENPLTK